MSLYEKSLELFADGTQDGESYSIFINKLLDGYINKITTAREKLIRKHHFIKNQIPELCVGLKKAGAVIAGGSILSAFCNFEIKDLDIYVNKKKMISLVNTLLNLGYRVSNSCLAPVYDQSFFKKNNIISRFVFTTDTHIVKTGYLIPIDVMVIQDNINVVDVVKNFDLSFCEAWFDGENVYAVDPDGITNKRGILKPDYNEALFKYFNRFILKRIKKYVKRGFNITYSISGCPSFFGKIHPEVKEITNLNTGPAFRISNDKIVYPEKWVVSFIYSLFIRYSCENNIELYKTFYLEDMTVENLFNLLKKYYHIINPGIYTFIRSTLESNINTESVENRERDSSGRLGDLKPEIIEKRINKKVKYLIKYILFSYNVNMKMYDNEWTDYINFILNKDMNRDEDKIINGENYYVDFSNNIKELNNKDKRLLTDVIYIGNLNRFEEINDGDPRYLTESELSKYGLIKSVQKFYRKVNKRDNIQVFNEQLIPNNFSILDVEEFEEHEINEYLDLDKDNFIFIFKSFNSKTKGYGLKKHYIYQLYSQLIVECKKSDIGLSIPLKSVFFDKWYNISRVGDSFNYGILLSKLNCVKDELDIPDGNRIFYLTEERTIDVISGVSNVINDNRSGTNIMGYPINVVSAAHCGSGTITHVYDQIYIIDKNKLLRPERFKEGEYILEEEKDNLDEVKTLEELFPSIKHDYFRFLLGSRDIVNLRLPKEDESDSNNELEDDEIKPDIEELRTLYDEVKISDFDFSILSNLEFNIQEQVENILTHNEYPDSHFVYTLITILKNIINYLDHPVMYTSMMDKLIELYNIANERHLIGNALSTRYSEIEEYTNVVSFCNSDYITYTEILQMINTLSNLVREDRRLDSERIRMIERVRGLYVLTTLEHIDISNVLSGRIDSNVLNHLLSHNEPNIRSYSNLELDIIIKKLEKLLEYNDNREILTLIENIRSSLLNRYGLLYTREEWGNERDTNLIRTAIDIASFEYADDYEIIYLEQIIDDLNSLLVRYDDEERDLEDDDSEEERNFEEIEENIDRSTIQNTSDSEEEY
jgi:hypothetical protein